MVALRVLSSAFLCGLCFSCLGTRTRDLDGTWVNEKRILQAEPGEVVLSLENGRGEIHLADGLRMPFGEGTTIEYRVEGGEVVLFGDRGEQESRARYELRDDILVIAPEGDGMVFRRVENNPLAASPSAKK